MPGWHNSNRRDQLPKDWARIRAGILRRDPTCRACGINASIDVDHITPGNDHTPQNLQGLCRHCHKQKTTAERPASGTQFQPRRRPPETHPGVTTTTHQRKVTTMSDQQQPTEEDDNAQQLNTTDDTDTDDTAGPDQAEQ